MSVFECMLVCEFGSGLGLILRLTLCVGVIQVRLVSF